MLVGRALVGRRLVRSFNSTSSSNKVVVIGSGAVGLYYGSRLMLAESIGSNGNEVHFILRGDFSRITQYGFDVYCDDGRVERIRPNAFSDRRFHVDASTIPMTNASDGVDWVLCCLKTHALMGGNNERDDCGYSLKIRSMIAPLVGKKTKILAIMNGLGVEAVFSNWFDAERVFGGMAFLCANRVRPTEENEPLQIKHIAHGALHIGHALDNPELLKLAGNLWHGSELESKVTLAESYLAARWSKLCWNLPFNSLAVALGGVSIDLIVTDPFLREYTDMVMMDTLHLANAHLEEQGVQKRITEDIRGYCWNLADSMGDYKTSTVLDLINNTDIEAQFLFRNPLEVLRRLKLKGLSFPHLEGLLLHVLGTYNLHKRVRSKGGYWVSNVLCDDGIESSKI